MSTQSTVRHFNPTLHGWERVRVLVPLVAALVLFALLSSQRIFGSLLALVGLVLWAASRKWKRFERVALGFLLASFLALVIPIDIRGPLHSRQMTGLQGVRMIPLVVGHPPARMMDNLSRGEIEFVGDLSSGWEPKYVIVW